MRNPYVFVVGCPRSGTTLLQRMLDNHPLLAVANDTHFIPYPYRRLETVADLELTSELVQSVRAYHRFPRLGIPDEAVERIADQAGTYSQFVSGLYSEFGLRRGKSLAGEKTPDYVRYLPLLHALFPQARIVHIIRDGRDVALSTLQWARDNKGPGKLSLWGEEPVAVCALWWRWQVTAGLHAGRDIGPARYHEVTYESLVTGPEDALARIAQFLDLPFDGAMLSYHEGRTRTKPGLSAKAAWLPPTPGLRDWRTQLAERDVELFEALAGDVLATLGYERAVTPVSAEIAAVAARAQSWWEAEMVSRDPRPRKPRGLESSFPLGGD